MLVTEHYSLALAKLVGNITPGKSIILDLGATQTGSTNVFLKLRCNCYVEDLNEFLEEVSPSDPDRFQKLKDHLLPKSSQLKFDYILCWDLLNYLDSELQAFLFEQLKPHFKTGTLLHCMRYTNDTMPATPGHFKIHQDLKFTMYEVDSNETPNISTIKMQKIMGDFSLQSSIMNQHGMKKDITDFIFVYGKASTQKQATQNTKPSTTQYQRAEISYSKIKMKCLTDFFKETKLPPKIHLLTFGRSPLLFDKLAGQPISSKVVKDVLLFKDLSGYNQSKLEAVINKKVLKFKPQETFDLVLLWDFISILHPPEIEVLLAHIKPHLNTGAVVHLIIPSSTRCSPIPPEYELQQDLSVSVRGNIKGDQGRIITRLSQIKSLFKGFKLIAFHFGEYSAQEKYLECGFLLND